MRIRFKSAQKFFMQFGIKKYAMWAIVIVAVVWGYYAWHASRAYTVRVPILAYHNVRPVNNSGPAEQFITPEEFEHELGYLKENGFTALTMQEFADVIRLHKSIPEKSVVLSFDDSWDGQYVYALPLLRRYGYKGTFFIWTDMLDKKGRLTSENLKELVSSGMEVGGHGKSHMNLADVTDANLLRREIVDDKKVLEDRIGMRVTSFAYAFGKSNGTVTDFVRAAGYASSRGVQKGAYHSADALFDLNAYVLSGNFSEFFAAIYAVDFPQERLRIQSVMDRSGLEAYRWFKDAHNSFPLDKQHLVGHMFGEVLYDTYGVSGLSVCDDDFIFACYHGFLGRAISLRGLGVIEELGRECDKKKQDRLGCDHGIGHGVMSYLGEDKLVQALEACDRLSWKGLVGGCSSGLFMEYNFKNSHVPENGKIVPRLLNEKNPFAPCDSLPGQFQYACYYEQPDWWQHVYHGDFSKIARLCDSIPDQYKEFCFIGTGRIIAQAEHFEIKASMDLCDKMPSPHAIAVCRSGGFLSIFDYTRDHDHSLAMCEGLGDELKYLCIEKANLFGTAIH